MSYFIKNVSGLIVLILCLLFHLYNNYFFNIYTISDIDACPKCIGESFCNCFTNNTFNLDSDHLLINIFNIYINNPLGKKVVIFGTCNDTKVVMKKLYKNVGQLQQYPIGDKVNNDSKITLDNLKESIKTDFRSFRKFNFCPDSNRLEVFLSPLIQNCSDFDNLYFNVRYMMDVNIEPLIQQVGLFSLNSSIGR